VADHAVSGDPVAAYFAMPPPAVSNSEIGAAPIAVASRGKIV